MAHTKTVGTLERARDAFVDIRDALENKTGESLDEIPVEQYDDIIEAIPSGEPVLDTLNVTPSTNEQTIVPEQGIDGFNSVYVDAVDNSIDSNIVAGNIKKDVEILGVTGTYEGGGTPSLQDKTVTPSTSQQVVSADAGYDGLDEVTVEAVDNSIDQNIVASNIKKDVSILGVTGTYEGSGANLQTRTVDGGVSTDLAPTPVRYTPLAGYDGFSEFSVTPARLEAEKVITPSNNEQIVDYASQSIYKGARKIRVGAVSSDIDQNIVPANIKKNVNILGVRGSYEGSGGGISLTNLAYFFYQNKRVPADYWDTVVTPNDGNVTDFSYMCRAANLAAGSYHLDVSGANVIASPSIGHALEYALFEVNAQGVVNFVVRLGANIRSLKNVFKFLVGQSGAYTNLSFDSTGDSYNVVDLTSAFKGTYGTLDLTEIKDNAFTYLSNAFNGVNILTDLIGIEDFDITHVTSLDEMFRSFNESPQYSSGFNELDLSGWDFSNITSVSNMFAYAYFNKVKFDGTSPFDSMKFNTMFQGSRIKNIENLYIKETGLKTGTGNVNQSMFENSGELLTITSPAKWVIHNGATKMFNNCQKLTSIPEIDLVIHSNASNKNQMDNMFSNCYALEEVTVNISYADDTPQPTYIGSMFSGCRSLKEIKGNFDISYVYNAYQLQSTFSGCTALEKIATTGGIAENLAQAITLDLSASAVFDIADFISNLAAKVTSQTRNIKLHSTVYGNLTQAVIDDATAKGYTLISA